MRRISFCRLPLKFYCYIPLFFSHPSLANLLNTNTFSAFHQCDNCVVATPSGAVFRGVLKQSILRPDVEFCSFLGLRYGWPSIGSSRFGKPILAEPSGPDFYNAIVDGNKCPQIPNGYPEGDEDCLFLNVFTPKTRTDHLKAVMVFLPGGSFSEGSTTSKEYSPDYLIEDDVIYVTVNYRNNVFGFLNLGIPESGGNMGLRDQITALEWIQRNIMSFGGDPRSVTLLGRSVGAISAYLLALSPLSRGLFDKLILQSVIGLSHVRNDSESNSIKYAEYMGYKGDTTDHHNRRAILNYLQSLTAHELLIGFEKFVKDRNPSFWPSLDSSQEDAVLPASLEEMGESAPSIPVIVGQTDMDGTIFLHQKNVDEVIANLQANLSTFLDPVYTQDKCIETEVITKVKEYYFCPKSDENILSQAIKLLTDLAYYRFYNQLAIFKESYYSHKMYNYQFTYDGSFQFFKRLFLGEDNYRYVAGVSHAEEEGYQYYSQRFTSELLLTANDLKVIRNLNLWWTNFAKTGNPNSNCTNTEVEWKPITPSKKYFIQIDVSPRFIETRINEERRAFWDSLPSTPP